TARRVARRRPSLPGADGTADRGTRGGVAAHGHPDPRAFGAEAVRFARARHRIPAGLSGAAGVDECARLHRRAIERFAPAGRGLGPPAGGARGGGGWAAVVAVLSHTRKGFESKQADLDRIAVRAQTLKDQFLAAVDADTAAF